MHGVYSFDASISWSWDMQQQWGWSYLTNLKNQQIASNGWKMTTTQSNCFSFNPMYIYPNLICWASVNVMWLRRCNSYHVFKNILLNFKMHINYCIVIHYAIRAIRCGLYTWYGIFNVILWEKCQAFQGITIKIQGNLNRFKESVKHYIRTNSCWRIDFI